MLLQKSDLHLDNFKDATAFEWLETNGLGGWAGSTICGANTRRYHGLLMASIKPPTERMLLVSKLDETLLIEGKRYELGTNDYGSVIAPQGYQFLRSFKKDFFPEWSFEAAGVELRKTITMVKENNTTLIKYEIVKAEKPFVLELLPLIAARVYHSLQHSYNNIYWKADFENGIFHNQPYGGAPHIYISVPGSSYQNLDEWYFHFNYKEEKYRGLDYIEDLFNHGIFRVPAKAGDLLYVTVSTNDPKGIDPASLFEKENERKIKLLNGVPGDLPCQLVLAADQFIVDRQALPDHENKPVSDLKTVIAGYHWFTDWGRDTMISLPGLCLCTDRAADAKKIISVFAGAVSQGMLPNRFPDYSEKPEYNTVDGTLWYFHAIYCYLKATGDQDFILKEVLGVLKEIIEWHFKGTRYQIHADTDGLLYAGETGQQLTWMDARVGNLVITPRIGKPVEIQALWYNALKVFESLLQLNGEVSAAREIAVKSDLTRQSFEQKFWNPNTKCLYDCLDEKGIPDEKIRPNQLFALSLPYHLIEGERAKAVLNIVKEKLYTPVGMRSLSPDDPDYKGHYGGNQLERDSAYHQGTVWSWLLGAYVDAAMKNLEEQFLPEAQSIINRMASHLNEACIGSVSEIFDGDAPHSPRGCIAQAWSVAEIIRLIKTYSLYHAGS